MKLQFSKKTYYIFLVLYCCLIFILSSIPGDKYPELNIPSADKLVHSAIYLVLFLLFFYSLKLQSKSVKLGKYAILFGILFTALYGITYEFHQLFVVNRTCDIYDWLADLLGACIGAILISFILKKNNNRLPFLKQSV